MTAHPFAPLLVPESSSSPEAIVIEGLAERHIRSLRAIALPDPTGICCAVVQAAVESLHGIRPVQQLTRLVSPEVYSELSARAFAQQSINKANGIARRPARTTAQGSGTSRSGSSSAPVRIIRARVLRINALAAEASVVLHDGTKVRAAALRIEEFRGRWRVSALHIG